VTIVLKKTKGIGRVCEKDSGLVYDPITRRKVTVIRNSRHTPFREKIL